MTDFCPCGLLKEQDQSLCPRCLKHPPKPKNEKRGQFRGVSKWAIKNKTFQGQME